MEYTFTTDNFEQEVLKSDRPVLVDFYADWCGPCKMMAPVLEKVGKYYEGKASILFVDVWENPNMKSEYGIQAIPTQIFYDKKSKQKNN